LIYTCISKKGDANGHPKAESMANITTFAQVGSHCHFGYIHGASSLICPSFGDAEKLQKL